MAEKYGKSTVYMHCTPYDYSLGDAPWATTTQLPEEAGPPKADGLRAMKQQDRETPAPNPVHSGGGVSFVWRYKVRHSSTV